MQPKDYFKKTFAFAFIFYIVYKSTVQLMSDFSKFTLEFIFKIVLLGLAVALILGGINYFAQFDFLIKKKEKNSKNNTN